MVRRNYFILASSAFRYLLNTILKRVKIYRSRVSISKSSIFEVHQCFDMASDSQPWILQKKSLQIRQTRTTHKATKTATMTSREVRVEKAAMEGVKNAVESEHLGASKFAVSNAFTRSSSVNIMSCIACSSSPQ